MPETREQESEIGILKSIRFQSDNGFVIATFANQSTEKKRASFSGLGNMVNPEMGLAYKMFGNWEQDSRFGQQFKFNFYEVMQPTDTKGIYQYLVRVCKWVGPTVAGRIVDKYKEETLDALRTMTPEAIAKDIKGLTAERATAIQKGLKENEHIEKALVELERLFAPISGIRKSLPMEIVKLWGSDAVSHLKENPYRITRLKGVGFPTADKLAMALGFDKKATAREKAAIWHCLNENMQAVGSVWMGDEQVFAAVKDLTGLGGREGLAGLYASGAVVVEKSMVALSEAAGNEAYIAEKIARMV